MSCCHENDGQRGGRVLRKERPETRNGFLGQTEQNVLWAVGWDEEKGWREVRKSQAGLCSLAASSERQREAQQTLQMNRLHIAGATDPDSWRPLPALEKQRSASGKAILTRSGA